MHFAEVRASLEPCMAPLTPFCKVWLAEPDPTHYTRHRLLATPKLGVHVTAPARSAACAAFLGSCAAAGQAVARQAVSRYRGWTVATRIRGLRGPRCQSQPAVMEESASQEVL